MAGVDRARSSTGRRPAAQNERDTKRASARPRGRPQGHSVAATGAMLSRDVPVAATIAQVRAWWVTGDWPSLMALDVPDLDRSEGRALRALLVASACLQLGQHERARTLLGLARSWGCPARLMAQVLLAGAHWSLGRAEALRLHSDRGSEYLLAGLALASDGLQGAAPCVAKAQADGMADIAGLSVVSVADLPARFGSRLPAPSASTNAFGEWSMARDDGPVLRYLFEAHQPHRHLEFGTWQGWGTCQCLESTQATVWTINLPGGESRADGSWAYAEPVPAGHEVPGAVAVTYGDNRTGPVTYHRTDAGAYVGRMYREKGLGHRVCQILCDSRDWDASCYPADFFDSVFVDGGHQPDVVVSDTRKALSVLRSGGLLVWHDFCPVPEAAEHHAVTAAVTRTLGLLIPEISNLFKELAWIKPSMMLMGIRK